ncbi:copper-binding transcription factor [Lambiella insularis]|nr:copper-binding transcription factor [Lambiella insularis]
MASPQLNPRRRNLRNTRSSATVLASQPLPISIASHHLKKSGTFHSPTSPSQEHDPILNIPSLPRRSFTSSHDLEALANSDCRIAHIIGAVDRSLSGLETFSSDSQETLLADASPIPLFMLYCNVDDTDRTDLDRESTSIYTTLTSSHPRTVLRKHHTSDSGIGSTVSSSEASISGDHAGMKQAFRGIRSDRNDTTLNSPVVLNEVSVQSGINGLTVSDTGSVTGTQHALSEYACRQIQKHIILPIIREEKLKEFHPLVSGIPYRVARKEITCLRDLEKVLLWLAPVSVEPPLWLWSLGHGLILNAKKWSTSKAAFLNFCETSIQCIHTTVNYINENDQRRPTDRPYTNGYILDLVEQVRQYATMLTASRARTASDPDSTPSEQPSSEERLQLVGGLGQTGRVAELVRTKDGRSISLRTGTEVSLELTSSADQYSLKRPLSEESDEDIVRSMARRRKSTQPSVKDAQKCNDCSKFFKRPCDLTKHEKTHSRPWKCSNIGCKYHEYGWPTEKERDRHVNDKHSSTPSMYKCHYSPCPYESKRESNCKQHMEKAHGWQYIRSKNNGKTGRRPQTGKTPPTPQMSTPGSYIFDAPTPEFQNDPTFYETSPIRTAAESLSRSMAVSDFPVSYTTNPVTNFNDTFGTFDTPFAWADQNDHVDSANMTDYSTSSHRPSWDAAILEPTALPSSFETSLSPQDEEPIFGSNFDWSNMDHDVTSLNIQLITPATSVHTHPFDAFSRHPSISHEGLPNCQVPSLSPGAKGDTMLYSPYSMQSNDISVDEGFVEFRQDILKPTHDFSLFDSSNAISSMNATGNDGMFQDLSTFNPPSTWSVGDLLPMEE